MPRLKQSDGGLTEFRRFRQQRRRRGMKQVRLWVPAPHRPTFAAEAKRQGFSLRGRAEESEALGFIAAALEWPEE